MADFSLYYPKLLVYEGGYASEDYAKKMGDSGGETYLGIARNYNPKWPGWKIIDAYKAKNGLPAYNTKINDPELYKLAEVVTKAKYWDVMKLDRIENQSTGEYIGDFGFNSGIGTSLKAVQLIIKTTRTGNFTDADIDKINADPETVFKKLQEYRINMIETSKKINLKFKMGLIKRAKSFTFKK